jgi:hypothetical protein
MSKISAGKGGGYFKGKWVFAKGVEKELMLKVCGRREEDPGRGSEGAGGEGEEGIVLDSIALAAWT